MAEKATLARPYARAVFELAEETRTFSEWSHVLERLSRVIQDPAVLELIKDRAIPSEQLVQFFSEVCAGSFNDRVKNFVAVLILHRRLEVLPDISTMYQALCAEAEKTVNVQLFSSVPLDENEQEKFRQFLEKRLARTVKMQCEIDKGLLGGFVAKAGNYVLDGSVRGFLMSLKAAMGE